MIRVLRFSWGRLQRRAMTHYAVYGNVTIVRTFCEECERWSLVLDGEKSCCGKELTKEPTYRKRMSCPERKRQPLTPTMKNAISRRQGGRCYYCRKKMGECFFVRCKPIWLRAHYDHIEPFAYSQNNSLDNFAMSCQLCNLWKNDRMFYSVEEVRTYVRRKWGEKTPREG